MQNKTIISLILAMADNGTIGDNNRLPWHLPNDLKFFKENTVGKPVIMGRKTYESIGRPLPNRPNIVITRQSSMKIEGCTVFNDLQSAITYCQETLKAPEVMIMGGAQIYREAIPLMNKLYLTHVHADVLGDTQMPPFDFAHATLIFEEFHAKDAKNPYDYTFEIWQFHQEAQ